MQAYFKREQVLHIYTRTGLYISVFPQEVPSSARVDVLGEVMPDQHLGLKCMFLRTEKHFLELGFSPVLVVGPAFTMEYRIDINAVIQILVLE